MGYTEAVPDWALNYIFNGEKEGLTDEEINMIETWLKEAHIDTISLPGDDTSPYFSYYPPFGKACEVYDCAVTYKNYPLDRNGKQIIPGAKAKWHDPDTEHRDLERIWNVQTINEEMISLWTHDKWAADLQALPSELEIIE